MASRIVIEEPCKHGRYEGHFVGNTFNLCTQSRRRVLTEGEYVLIEKVDGEWPRWAYSAVHSGDSIFEPEGILDALAGGGS